MPEKNTLPDELRKIFLETRLFWIQRGATDDLATFRAIAAVLDRHEQLVRAKVAEEIEAAGKTIGREPHCIMPGLHRQWERAAKIARGDSDV